VSSLDPSLPAPEEYDALCESCGYSLIALAGDRCPECGTTFDPAALPLARVPWLYRKRLGVVSAFLVTAGRILTRPYAFAQELTRPVRISLDDARSFRTVCIRLATLSMVLAVFACLAIVCVRNSVTVQQVGVAALAILVSALPARVFFSLITDLPTFIWAGLEQKPDALAPPHYYASAPLILVPLAAMLIVAACWANVVQGARSPLSQGLLLAIFGVCLITLASQWVIAQRFAAAASVPTLRRVLLGLYLPIHWLMAIFICGMVSIFIISGAGWLVGK
jgi:hypothetical protein